MLEHPEDALPSDFVDEMLCRADASAYLAGIGVRRTVETLAKIQCTRTDGPPCMHAGRRVLYSKRELHLWGIRQLTALRSSPKAKRLETADKAGPRSTNQ